MDHRNESKITKDTTARKNTIQPGMVTAREVAAIKAAHDAYLSSMIAGYEEEIRSLKTRHAQELEVIQMGHEEALQRLRTTIQLNDTVIAEKQTSRSRCCTRARSAGDFDEREVSPIERA
ncbi:hypothetical protein Tdes44962_MAKER04014 [Teratosphaeria destructans]|uniref:Uncharacterized protein n=1 Tax=Teratosphaeria destructans TaxID=418781 RepID=A0A9W7W0I6_9PEZI|nr:hypothetical protein Tdes44962_MAKER04014 [Teratosphaeria destructans]